MSHVIAPGLTNSFQLYHTLKGKRGPKSGIELSRFQIAEARRMARADYTTEQIRDALGLSCKIDALQYKLKQFNIRPRTPKNQSAHRGGITTIPHSERIETRNYRPKPVGAE